MLIFPITSEFDIIIYEVWQHKFNMHENQTEDYIYMGGVTKI